MKPESKSNRIDWKGIVDGMRFGDFLDGLNRSEAANLRKAINRQINARAVEKRQPDGSIRMWKTERDVLLTGKEASK